MAADLVLALNQTLLLLSPVMLQDPLNAVQDSPAIVEEIAADPVLALN
jgi:hypothetical protein